MTQKAVCNEGLGYFYYNPGTMDRGCCSKSDFLTNTATNSAFNIYRTPGAPIKVGKRCMRYHYFGAFDSLTGCRGKMNEVSDPGHSDYDKCKLSKGYFNYDATNKICSCCTTPDGLDVVDEYDVYNIYLIKEKNCACCKDITVLSGTDNKFKLFTNTEIGACVLQTNAGIDAKQTEVAAGSDTAEKCKRYCEQKGTDCSAYHFLGTTCKVFNTGDVTIKGNGNVADGKCYQDIDKSLGSCVKAADITKSFTSVDVLAA